MQTETSRQVLNMWFLDVNLFFIFYHFKLSVLFAILYIHIECSYLNLGVNSAYDFFLSFKVVLAVVRP